MLASTRFCDVENRFVLGWAAEDHSLSSRALAEQQLGRDGLVSYLVIDMATDNIVDVGIEKKTLVDHVYDRIKTAIFEDQFPAGTELNQVDLARRFGVSRVPVREALRRLQAERLVSATPYQRIVVSALKPNEVLELHDVRVELEVFALKQAMKKPRDSLVGRIAEAERILADMRARPIPEVWKNLDRRFHLTLNGQDAVVSEMIEDLRDRVHRYLSITNFPQGRTEAVLAEHVSIIAALRSGNETKVETAFRYHADHTRDALEQVLAVNS